MSVLVAAVTLLSALTALNLFILLGVVRRLRELSTGQGLAMEPGLPSIGDRISTFTESTVDSEVITERQLREGRTLVLFLSPTCQPCLVAANRLAEWSPADRPRTVVFIQGEAGDRKVTELRRILAGAGTVATISSHSEVSRAFGGISGYPVALLVDDGAVTAVSLDLAEVLAAAERPSLVPR